MNDLRQFTVFAINAIAFFVGVLDVAFSHFGGNKSTISRVCLDAQGQNPAVAFLMCYSFGGLMAHLFWPTMGPFPTVWATVWKSLLFMAPVFYLCYLMTTVQFGGVPKTGEAFLDWEAVIRLPFAKGMPVIVEMAVGAVSGVLLAKWLVPQHVADRLV